MRRALSTAYYALFHAMCWNCADCLIGGKQAQRSEPAWAQAYRAVNHGFAKEQCKNNKILKKFPKEIEDFGNMFVQMQIKRHEADYDPIKRYSRSEVTNDINAAEEAIRTFVKIPMKDKRDFAAWIAFKKRA